MTPNKEQPTQRSTNRYPGLRPFVRGDQLIFFGRNTEIDELVQSIRVNPSFILFGKSGLGKSSLVNAGVMPNLVRQGYSPLVIRFYNSAEDPLLLIAAEVRKQLPATVVARIPAPWRDSLHVLFAHWNKRERPILIFDQFEEFFYHDAASRERCMLELSFLLNKKSYTDELPDKAEGARLKEFLKDLPATGTDRSVQLLFLIRSDRLNLMNEVSEKIPGIFNNRYELKPLQREKAEQAIVLPAQIPPGKDTNFVKCRRPFDYDLDALKIILSTLSNAKGEIESSQLQIVCQELEEIAGKKEALLPEATDLSIGMADFNGEEGIREILNQFYWKQLNKLKQDKALSLTQNDLKIIRRIIEIELVSGTKRIIQSETKIREIIKDIRPNKATVGGRDKIDVVIDKLLDLRLIREEESHLGKVYEISHDTLLASIIRSRDEQIKEDQKKQIAAQKRQLHEEQRKAEFEKKLKDKARRDRQAAIQAKEAVEKAAKVSGRYLTIAIASLVVVVGLAVGLIAVIGNLSSERGRLRKVNAKLLVLNAGATFDNNDHALAFNLASYADSLSGRKGKLLDSLLGKWSLFEYPGTPGNNYNDSLLSVHYTDNTLQVFYLADTLRKKNPSIRFNDVEFSTFSTRGKFVALWDTLAKVIRVYRLDIGQRIDTVLLDRISYSRGDWQTVFTDTYLALTREDSIYVYSFRDKTVCAVACGGPSYYSRNASNRKYLYWERESAKYQVARLDVKTGLITRMDSCQLIGDISVPYKNYIYNRATRLLSGIAPDSLIPLARLKDNDIYQASELSNSLVVAGDDQYYFLSGARPENGQLNPTRVAYPHGQLGNIVRGNAGDTVWFINNDTLSAVANGTLVSRSKISNMASALLFGQLHPFLAPDGSAIYCLYTGKGFLGKIAIRSRNFSILPGLKLWLFRMIGGDFYRTQGGYKKLTGEKKDAAYWENFYEPLTPEQRSRYDIPDR